AGLSGTEAAERLKKLGPTRLPDANRGSPVLRFLRHFNHVLSYVLLGAATVTAIIGHWIDTWVILGVVVINAVIGYIQEGRAEKALASIRNMLSPTAQVLRDGRRADIEAEHLVAGDILYLKAGDRVPADLRLLDTSNLRIEESALTGESENVEKQTDPVEEKAALGDRTCMAYSGTTVRYGTGTAVVVATGVDTELGRISEMLGEADDLTTPLIRSMNRFTRQLTAVIGVVATLLFLYGLLGNVFGINELLLAIIGLAVAAIPEGLPAILTITLAIGVRKMARERSIVRKLPAVETLGSVTVICTDKTGTLTRNEMTATSVRTCKGCYEVEGAGYAPEGRVLYDGTPVFVTDDVVLRKLARIHTYCNEAEVTQEEDGSWTAVGQPTEAALRTLAIKSGQQEEASERLDSLPFDSTHKYSAALHTFSDESELMISGAPVRLLNLCTFQMSTKGGAEPLDRAFWETQIQQGADDGQRMLGAAFRTADGESRIDPERLGDLVFVGIAGLIDPPRPEAIQAIRDCQRAGIRVIMITGDHAITASVIGKAMGIGDGSISLTGGELEAMDDDQLREAVRSCDIFARTTPEHKLRLVRALQQNGEICAMTGDGVNDAPALKQAEIGIAMGIKGTEVTKDAAEMVLADDNFATIAKAVEEGRTVYANLRKTLLFILPTNGAEALVILVAIVAGATLPVTPLQILWVNMVTAVTLALSLAFEPTEPGTMSRPPRPATASVMDKTFLWRILFVSVLIGGLTYLLYGWQSGQSDPAVAQTLAVNVLVAGQLFYLFNCRSIETRALSKGFFANPFAFAVAGILIVLQLGFTYLPFMNRVFGTTPLRIGMWVYPIGAGLLVFGLVELEKTVRRSWNRRKKSPTRDKG
ncbi:MAG: cation-transporting P-type ATPase, partial [Clostridiaceae bacterium]|nr:cation-transporting P-type ATPase [Clostridiaceae bacterium]